MKEPFMSRRNEILEYARRMMKGGAVQLKVFKCIKEGTFITLKYFVGQRNFNIITD